MVHGLPSLQLALAPELHAEFAQTSPVVQALPSLQGRLFAVNTQPVAALHASLVQALLSLQTVETPGTHAPFAHASPLVQTLPSEHTAFVLANTQPVAELQVSAVHGLPSLHVTAAPPAQAPAAHASPLVHALPSEQLLLLFACTQPPPAPHESVVQGLPSSQLIEAPDAQPPPAQASPFVHALLSEHGALLFVFTQPLVGSQASSVHRLPSLQLSSEPGWHAPVAQTSPLVQALLSLHGTVLFTCEQPPAALHASVVHRLPSSQASAGPGTHTPLAHASLLVQSFASVQGKVLFVNVHPLAGLQTSFVQGFPSLQVTTAPALHAPLLQMSPCVQALPSLQGTVLFVCVQPFVASQTSVVHGLLSSQLATVPPLQMPPAHASFTVQELPSSQVLVFGVKVQPVAGLQESVVHGLPSEHGRVPPAVHAPLMQMSLNVHTLPSEHAALVFAWTQPLIGSQVSAVQGLLSSQVAAEPGTHAPPAQTSPWVQPLLSEQPSLLNTNVQPSAGSHVSVVQGLPSLHGRLAPGTHAPAAQTSPTVQRLLSLQPSVLLTAAQPVVGLQVSVVQRLPSSQVLAAPGSHAPAVQTSPTVQALPSEHGTLVGVNTQPPASVQVSVVQGLPSLQLKLLPAAQVPPAQMSPAVQELPSEQGSVLFDVTQPLIGSHASVVHGLLSSQVLDVPGTHWPLTHVSPTVQTLPSEHVSVVVALTQPKVGSHASVVQGLPSLQVGEAPPMQAPSLHVSFTVHALPSEQPAAIGWKTQPLIGSQ